MKHINIFYKFFSIYKHDKIITKNTIKDLKKSKWKISKPFWRGKRQNVRKAWERYQNLTEEEEIKDKYSKNLFEEQKKKSVEYRRNDNLTHE